MRSTYRVVLFVGLLGLLPAGGVSALPGLQQLQEAAKSDQACECMVHEYTRRYNEVLRECSAAKEALTEEKKTRAHEEAMQWVRSVWRFADQQVVEQRVHSTAFQSATAMFRQSQELAYPHLPVVP